MSRVAISVLCLCVAALAQSSVKPQAYWTAAGAAAFTTAWDGWQTANFGAPPCSVEVDNPFLLGRTPQRNPARVAAVHAGEFALAAFLSWKLHRHKYLWWIPLTFLAEEHGRGVIHNLRVCHGD